MRALVTGGAGFLGRHLCHYLLDQGYQVVALDNFATSSPHTLQALHERPGFAFLQHDIVRPLDLDGPLDAILHLASPASPPYFIQHPVETLEVSSFGSHHLLEMAAERRARFLLASTSEVYGDPKENPQREEYRGNVTTVGPRSSYDEGKRFAEALAVAYHHARGVDIRIARIFNTYGPGMQAGDGRVIPNFVSQALRGQPLTVHGSGLQTRSFCYVSDLVEGLYKLLLSDVLDPVNIGNPGEVTVLDLAHMVLEMTGSASPITHLASLQDDPQVRCPDITRARTLLGWEPQVGLREGLQRTIADFRARQDSPGG